MPGRLRDEINGGRMHEWPIQLRIEGVLVPSNCTAKSIA